MDQMQMFLVWGLFFIDSSCCGTILRIWLDDLFLLLHTDIPLEDITEP